LTEGGEEYPLLHFYEIPFMAPGNKIRVRFAPSPTGYLHIGGARTALFNYLLARQRKGRFLLRIEDTDQSRSDPLMTESILNSLKWMGLTWDEEPVYQSSRLERYKIVCKKLHEKGFAYPCFCSPDELKKKREAAERSKQDTKYDRTCKNLTLDEIQDRLNRGLPYVLRLFIPQGQLTFQDAVKGKVTVQNQEIDDFVILRSDNTPVYQIAVVVDDHDMGITHVIRGDDHLSNTPKQILLYHALGWKVPEYAHVPLILGPDGKRLSKRYGATSVEVYRELGFLPQAFTNYIALLGWSPGDNREIMSFNEMQKSFSLDRIIKKAAVFDNKKLEWMNGQYLNQLSSEQLFEVVVPFLIEDNLISQNDVQTQRDFIIQFIRLIKERVRRLSEFSDKGSYFFRDPEKYEDKAIKKYWNSEEVNCCLQKLIHRLQNMESWSADEIEKTIRFFGENEEVGVGTIIHPIRLALTGSSTSPGLFEMMEVLGRVCVLRRINKALNVLP
jgi:glutamyl-tRNA synthetase